LAGMQPNTLKRKLAQFWIKNISNFNLTLLNKLNDFKNKDITVVCASASPEIFISDICMQIGITHIIGTKIEFKKGLYYIIGNNCRGIEKLNRIYGLLGSEIKIIEAYSDNIDDRKLLEIADNGYIVFKNNIIKV
jgi:phosphoserine phosphatase